MPSLGRSPASRRWSPTRNGPRLWKYPDGSFGGLTLPDDPTKARRSIVVDKIGVKRDIVADEFPFLKQNTKKAIAKYTFPAPSWHRIAWDPKHSRDAYPTAREFLLAMRDYIREVVQAVDRRRLRLHPHGCAELRAVAHRPEDPRRVRVVGPRHGQGADRGRRDRQLGVRRHHAASPAPSTCAAATRRAGAGSPAAATSRLPSGSIRC